MPPAPRKYRSHSGRTELHPTAGAERSVRTRIAVSNGRSTKKSFNLDFAVELTACRTCASQCPQAQKPRHSQLSHVGSQ